MSKYIKLDDAIGIITEHQGIRGDTFKALHNAYAVDIVRCRECKHNYNKVLNHGKMKPRCDFTDRVLTENDFCSRGEREGE